ncbi:Por secretion system C-terminal sorting domain-containing protein [Aquimarina amphilecti]|uniref:Por secretion system C-terminal sorting domain-containing protein n=1 Tax=Aquimarina amphilecti TaxID=1038014 RepID=A0A1H7SKT2_AQUAM|nr:T9SS type A sorting domain-containing protein [Aquimarina amphilecti]SEL73123.1 Por secretion system C-terminal sorting domain-containing protein [Aquimarina amphilecti]
MKTISTFLMVWIVMATQAQSIDISVISNAGGTESNTSNILSFTIGETFTETISNSQSIDQGFWSGIGSLNQLSTEEFLTNIGVIRIHPNPVSDFFTISIPDINNYTISLYNLNGQEVITKEVNATLIGHQINISSLAQGTYILRLSIPETNENKVFKIIKK